MIKTAVIGASGYIGGHLLKTYREAIGRMDVATPLGYSSAGIVEECGVVANEFSPGDHVACIGKVLLVMQNSYQYL